MKLKEQLEKFYKNEYLCFVLTLFKIYDIIKPVLNNKKMTVSEWVNSIDWLGDGLFFVVVILLYFCLKNNRILKEQLSETKLELTSYKQTIDDYNADKRKLDLDLISKSFVGNRAMVAYLNSLSSKDDVFKIASIFLQSDLKIPECEKAGFSIAIITAMRTIYFNDELTKQEVIIDSIYPENNN